MNSSRAQFGPRNLRRFELEDALEMRKQHLDLLALWDVSKVPIADSCTASSALFDHLVGPGEQHPRDGEAEHLGGFQVDNQLDFGRLLDRQVGWLLAPE